MNGSRFIFLCACFFCAWPSAGIGAAEWHVPYDAPRTQRENVFAFTQKPKVKYLGHDKFEISFSVKGRCDVTVAVMNSKNKVVRHLASGVLGQNAPPPFQKDSLTQTLYWTGKDDFGHYVKEPEKLSIKVSLGLKPAFDRILGWNPYDTRPWDVGGDARGYQALVADESGVHVMLSGYTQLRKFKHDASYARTVIPPPANLPLNALKGFTKLEFAPDRYTPQDHFMGRIGQGNMFPNVHYRHAATANGRMIFGKGNLFDFDTMQLANGATGRLTFPKPKGQGFSQGSATPEFLALSPDGKRLYVSGLLGHGGVTSGYWANAVYRLDLEKQEAAKVFVGIPGKLGRDNKHFTYPAGLACDAQGRVYVCDCMNNRIQIFSSDGAYLKTIPIPSPYDIRINRKNGAIVVLQFFQLTRQGRGVTYNPKNWNKPSHYARIACLEDFDHPKETASFEIREKLRHPVGRSGPLFALDYWSNPPRVWVGPDRYNMRVFEIRGKTIKPHLNFVEAVKKAGNLPFMMKMGPMPHDISDFIMTDPLRGHVYLYHWKGLGLRWDLNTGAHLRMQFPTGSWTTCRAFDGRGFSYAHINKSITRHDPGDGFREVPLDYGVEPPDGGSQTNSGGCIGAVALKDQGYDGHKNGIGVNMQGDMAVISSIAYVPKMDDNEGLRKTLPDSRASQLPTKQSGSSMYVVLPQGEGMEYRNFKSRLAKAQKRGESIYSVKRYAGRILRSDTVWVFNRTGELRSEDAIKGLGLASGIEIDEDGFLYTLCSMQKMRGGKPFLQGRLQLIGQKPEAPIEFPTSTLLKVSPKGAKIFSKRSEVPMDQWPTRPMDFKDAWIEGAEWLYGGASAFRYWGPRHGLDWYKRCFVPENYRHSVGILDTNGNLIMHLGQYGNADSGRGSESPVKVGGDEIAFSYVIGVAATDTHLCVADFGNERIISLKLNYHQEEIVPIKGK